MAYPQVLVSLGEGQACFHPKDQLEIENLPTAFDTTLQIPHIACVDLHSVLLWSEECAYKNQS